MADANLTAAKARREAWVRDTLPGAVAYAASLLRDRQAADDVVHDCYCRLLQKADVYDLDRDGTKILYRSISNACINRNTREHPHIPLDDPERSGPGVPSSGWEHPGDGRGTAVRGGLRRYGSSRH